MAKIKRIAIATQDSEKTAQFYKEVFGLREIEPARRAPKVTSGLDHFLGIRIDPGFGKVDDKPLGIIARFETVAQSTHRVAKTLAIALPGNLRAGAPVFCGLI